MNFQKLLMGLVPPRFLAGQARKPSGWFGRNVMVRLFNQGNEALNDWMLQTLAPQAGDLILEIGFGSGKWLPRLIQSVDGGKVFGVDFSDDMTRRVQKLLQEFIQKGKLEIKKSELSQIPYPDHSFDKICSANTLYFWKDPSADILEIKRVLKPGGKLVLGFRTREQMQTLGVTKHGFTHYSEDEVKKLLSDAGFQNVSVLQRPEKAGFHSYCAVGIVP